MVSEIEDMKILIARGLPIANMQYENIGGGWTINLEILNIASQSDRLILIT